MPKSARGNRRATCGSQLWPPSTRIPGIELGPSGLAVSSLLNHVLAHEYLLKPDSGLFDWEGALLLQINFFLQGCDPGVGLTVMDSVTASGKGQF